MRRIAVMQKDAQERIRAARALIAYIGSVVGKVQGDDRFTEYREPSGCSLSLRGALGVAVLRLYYDTSTDEQQVLASIRWDSSPDKTLNGGSIYFTQSREGRIASSFETHTPGNIPNAPGFENVAGLDGLVDMIRYVDGLTQPLYPLLPTFRYNDQVLGANGSPLCQQS